MSNSTAPEDCLILQTLWPTLKSPLYLNSTDCCQTKGTVFCLNNKILIVNLPNAQAAGTIPDGFSKLSGLAYLDLSNNRLTGSIPTDLSSLSILITDLNLSNSGATGPIPQNISLLNGLIVLDMSNNNLQGNIPTGLGNLFFLQVLRLNSNKLNGSIPSELSRLTKLENLQVQDNLLSGNVPDLSDLPLTSVGLHNNQLFGPLPDNSIGALSKLSELDLSLNALTGSIPQEWENLKLKSINLDGNKLTGPVPSAWASLVLTSCQLNGLCLNAGSVVPPSCGVLPQCTRFDLSWIGIMVIGFGCLIILVALLIKCKSKPQRTVSIRSVSTIDDKPLAELVVRPREAYVLDPIPESAQRRFSFDVGRERLEKLR
ncbi:hypothetical protein EDD86DRAFT_193849 [Gorgonomyces haynaldii]|nr:hypothetical protein EDD86DRAFT_193849 [Gorgonomyces haynaldii]